MLGSIWGRVEDEDGDPLPEVTVELTCSCSSEYLATAVTDEDGYYLVPEVPYGLAIRVTVPDHPTLLGNARIPMWGDLYQVDVGPVDLSGKTE